MWFPKLWYTFPCGKTVDCLKQLTLIYISSRFIFIMQANDDAWQCELVNQSVQSGSYPCVLRLILQHTYVEADFRVWPKTKFCDGLDLLWWTNRAKYVPLSFLTFTGNESCRLTAYNLCHKPIINMLSMRLYTFQSFDWRNYSMPD